MTDNGSEWYKDQRVQFRNDPLATWETGKVADILPDPMRLVIDSDNEQHGRVVKYLHLAYIEPLPDDYDPMAPDYDALAREPVTSQYRDKEAAGI